MPKHLRNWPWLTLQIIAANVIIILALASAWYFTFMRQSTVYSDRLMSTFNIEPGSLHAMYVDDVEHHLWISVSLGLLVAIMASVALAFLIVRPIRSLAKATEQLRHGNYSVRSTVESGEVGALAVNFNSLAASLEREEQRRSQFLTDLGHELRTPITSLQGFTEGLEDGVFRANKEYFKLMSGELSHLTSLTKTIHKMQLETYEDDCEMKFEELTLVSLLNDSRNRWRSRFDNRQLQLGFSIPPCICQQQLAIPSRAFRQIIDNLLSNMHRYARSNTLCLITSANAHKSEFISIAFSNETMDVTEDCLPYLFDRFYRVSKSRTRVHTENSSGLGLSVVRQLCHSYNGNAVASLDQGRLVISITLPVCRAH